MKHPCVWLALWLGAALVTRAAEVTVTFEFRDDQVSFHPVDGYEKVLLQDGVLPEDPPGAPWLPAKYVNILIPSGAKVLSVAAVADETLLRAGVTVYPAQPPQRRSGPKNPFVPADPAAYAGTDLIPAAAATLAGAQTMHGCSFASVRLNPIRYIPAAGAVYLARRLAVTVTYSTPRAPLAAPAAHRAERMADVMALVANPGALAEMAPATLRAPAADTAGQYLIITRAALSNAFSALAAHRAARFNTKVLTVETITNAYAGTDIQQRIRNCITDYYQNHGCQYVVLGGDDTIVIDRDCKVSVDSDVESKMPTDLYYSGLDGTWDANGNGVYGEVTDNVDMAWEVIVGRIPVRTAAQATDYINKLIAFENSPPLALARKIILGGMVAWDTYTGTGRPSDDVTTDGHAGFRATSHPSVSDSEMWDRRLYRDGIKPYWQAQTIGIFCDTLTSWDTTTAGDYLENATNVRKRFNEGWWHLYFSGHGSEQAWGLESGEFSSTDGAALTNKTCFVYTDACLTGHFDGTPEPCLSEAMLRNAAGGALIYIGCSRYGWGEPDSTPASNTSDGGPSTQYGYKYYQRLYQSNNVTCGKAFAMHKADKIAQCGSNGSERWIQFGLNLQGDPAILPSPAAESPPILNLIGNRAVQTSNNLSFVVTAMKTDGDPVTNMWVTGKPASASFGYTPGNTNGLFTWTNAAPAGVYTMVFWVADNDGSVSETITVSVTNAPAGGAAAIRFQGFEGAAADTWTYTMAAGAGTIAVSSDRAAGGTKSLKLSGSSAVNADPSVEFANLSLSSYSGVRLSIAFSASGPDTDDDLWLDLSDDNGATWSSTKLVDGYGSCNIPFGETRTYNPTTVSANPYVVAIPDGTAQLKVRIRYDEKGTAANLSDHYYLDDVSLTGTPGGGSQSPPILNPIGGKSVQVSNTLSFVVTATKTDGDPVTNMWVTGKPAAASFGYTPGNTNGLFTWTNAAPAGVYTMVFWAADNDGSDSEEVTITVTNPVGGSGETLKFQGFEGSAGDTWNYTKYPGAGAIEVRSDRYQSGAYSLRLTGSSGSNSDPRVIFDNVSIAGSSDVRLAIAFSASGPDADDDLYLDISYDDGANYTSTKLVDGYSSANLAFGATSATNPATVAANPFIVNIPADKTQVKIRIRFDEKAGAANTADHYFIDDVKLYCGGAIRSRGPLGGEAVWINEVNYDTPGTDSNEYVEVAGTAGASLAGWKLHLYRSTGGTGDTVALSGSIDDEGCGYGAVAFAAAGIQNGPSNGIALVNASTTVVQFLSYEGLVTATNGPAAGLTSELIPVSQVGTNDTIQLRGAGTNYPDFTWILTTASQGALNISQSIAGCSAELTTNIYFGVSTASVAESVGVYTVMVWKSVAVGSVTGEIAVSGTAGGSDYTLGGSPFTLNGAVTGAVVTVAISNDVSLEPAETVVLILTNVAGGTVGAPATFTLTITDDDLLDSPVWINEVNYDPPGADAGEFVEVAGVAGTSLEGWSVVLYNGSDGNSYNTIALSGSLDDEGCGYGARAFAASGFQNGAPDGLALVNPATTAVLFISYEGSFTANNGPAQGMTSLEIGAQPDSATRTNTLQLIGTATNYALFVWANTNNPSPGDLNALQAITGCTATNLPAVTITNPAAETITVPFTTAAADLAGTCNAYVAGELVWDNNLTGGSGAIAAAPEWGIPGIVLGVGTNVITVSGTNSVGIGDSDSVAIVRLPQDSGGDPARTIRFQGFEGTATDTWGYVATPGWGLIEVTNARVRTGQYALRLAGSAESNSDPYVVFDSVDISGYQDVQVYLGFSALGPDSADDLYFEVSYDGGATWDPSNTCKLVDGYASMDLAFGETSAQTINANPYVFDVPAGQTQIMVRVRYDEGASSDNSMDYYFIDDLRLTGDAVVMTDDDADGLDDNWEIRFFGAIDAPTATAGGNPDGDELNNWEELILDRNPTNAGAPDTKFTVRIGDDGEVNFDASVQRNYTLYYSWDLSNPAAWTNLPAQTRIRGTNTTMTLDDPVERSRAFYRIGVTLP